jgi:hypothetical protein
MSKKTTTVIASIIALAYFLIAQGAWMWFHAM